jgi:hypothetical protein
MALTAAVLAQIFVDILLTDPAFPYEDHFVTKYVEAAYRPMVTHISTANIPWTSFTRIIVSSF